MPKFIFLFITLFSGINTAVANSSNQQHHQHHNLMSYHGMVVFSDKEQNLYASHLPLYVTPHNYQIIYKIETPKDSEVKKLLSASIVTLLPAKFDLTKLVNKEKFSITGKIFKGHFERGGLESLETEITFREAVLVEKVNSNFSQANTSFYIQPISQKQALWVHKIQSSPSFDAIGFIDLTNDKALDNSKSCPKPAELTPSAIKNQLKKCGLGQLTYLETRDFS